MDQNQPDNQNSEEMSLILELLIAILIIVVLAASILIGHKVYKRYYRVPDTLIEEEMANRSSSAGVEL